MRIAVMGAGGAGGYFGGKLALAREDVTFIARGPRLQAIGEHGLLVRIAHHGDFTVFPAQATDNPGEAGTAELVLFCVKTWDTRSAGEAINPLVDTHTFVISLQKGVNSEETLGEILGAEHILGGVAFIESAIAAPGVIEHSSALAKLIFGELDGRRSARARAFLDACRKAGTDAELSEKIQTIL